MRLRLLAALLLLPSCASPTAPAASPAPSPSVSATPAFNDPAALAFAPDGALWVGSYYGHTLSRFPAATLARSGVPRADVVLSSPRLAGPNALAFDRDGWLWAPTYDEAGVVGYSPAGLRTGTQAPTVVIEGRELDKPTAVAFDAAGNLWVSNAGNGLLLRYPHAALHARGARPDVVLTVPNERCQGVAVDPAGWLWLSCVTHSALYGWPPGAVARSGHPKPAKTVTWPPLAACGPTLLLPRPGGLTWIACYELPGAVAVRLPASGPAQHAVALTGERTKGLHGIAFDAAGNLWIGTNLELIMRVPKARLTTGAIRPDVELRPV
jgi:sugar lactone lactonase YvrE